MLILPDGRHIGGISGGCLEGEVIRKAWWFTESETPIVRIYDTSSDDDAVWEFGLGCNGVVHVLLERSDRPGAVQMLAFLDANRRKQTSAVVATVVRSEDASIQVGDRLLIDKLNEPTGELVQSHIESQVLAHAALVFLQRHSCLVHLGSVDVFIEFVSRPLSLVIFGAGHDAIPLVNVASELGWNITVADGRPAYAKPDRFPGASHVVTLQGNDFFRDIHIDHETAVVVMTHNFPMDVRLMPLILEKSPQYLGVLGPKTRAEKLFREIGLPLPPDVHAPVGLDIGCDTPETIALSITADIQATISQRSGRRLMLRDSSIHAPAMEIGNPTSETTTDALRPSYCETTVGSNV
jgi:xanthine/CO dehydrogenase XdhC/CoxF family maturation factor